MIKRQTFLLHSAEFIFIFSIPNLPYVFGSIHNRAPPLSAGRLSISAEEADVGIPRTSTSIVACVWDRSRNDDADALIRYGAAPLVSRFFSGGPFHPEWNARFAIGTRKQCANGQVIKGRRIPMQHSGRSLICCALFGSFCCVFFSLPAADHEKNYKEQKGKTSVEEN